MERLQRCCTPRRPGWARWIWASCRGRAARRSTPCWVAASICCGCSALMSSTPGRIGAETFVVYQGHHGDRGAAGRTWSCGCGLHRKSGTYVNTEGREQRGYKATSRRARRGRIGRSCGAFSAVLGRPLPYDTIEALRARLETVNPVFGHIGYLPRFGVTDTAGRPATRHPSRKRRLPAAFADYYQTNPISRASEVMARMHTRLRTHARPGGRVTMRNGKAPAYERLLRNRARPGAADLHRGAGAAGCRC